ncbi:hypothetical protein SCLCIDRAFT_1213550 [Scleroderma citrinum Foug A]|uniref:Glutaredoxin domain-containing protein n=1 Tax=Scleroderma citrinum Foug A TaxID=1036808 RepID=A0A0C3DU53_9AGAM|nr:hypothetical protein SCLCIDRAFT_1213550 [Scleroderma citrinum Foug A]
MSVREFVESTIKDNKIVVFSKTWCSYSRAAKAYFADNFPDEKVRAVELDDRPDIQNYLHTERTKLRTVPQVFINGYFIGGCDDLRAKPKDEVRGLINGPHV